jgi:spermidine/putrescine transport system substrate-binding protein
MLWTDNVVIPARARAKADAERLMNYYYRPRVAAQLADYVRYTCPVLGADAAMRQIDPALAGDPYIFPTPQLLHSGHYFKLLTPAQSRLYNTAYQNAVGL